MKTVCARRRCCLASRPRLKTKRVGLMCSAAPFESSPAGMACRRPGTDQAGTAGRGRTPRRPRRAASWARSRNRPPTPADPRARRKGRRPPGWAARWPAPSPRRPEAARGRPRRRMGTPPSAAHPPEAHPQEAHAPEAHPPDAHPPEARPLTTQGMRMRGRSRRMSAILPCRKAMRPRRPRDAISPRTRRPRPCRTLPIRRSDPATLPEKPLRQRRKSRPRPSPTRRARGPRRRPPNGRPGPTPRRPACFRSISRPSCPRQPEAARRLAPRPGRRTRPAGSITANVCASVSCRAVPTPCRTTSCWSSSCSAPSRGAT